MSIELTFLGHSGILICGGGHTVVIDPFLTGNPVAKHQPADITCQTILVTHGHADHVGDAVAIAKANNAPVIGAFELCDYFAEQGCQTNPGNPGGKIDTDFGWVALTQAFHSSSYQGRYMGQPCGAVVHIAGVTIYHLGDTALFSDLQLLGDIYKPDIACIPVGDRFTMGPALGARAAEMIKPKIAIPVHYGTWPLLTDDLSDFTPQGVKVQKMQVGETLVYG